MYTNKQRRSLIKKFREGGDATNYVSGFNEERKSEDPPVVYQPQQIVAKQDSKVQFNPQVQNIDYTAIDESNRLVEEEKLYNQKLIEEKNIRNQRLIDEEVLNRTPEQLNNIPDYIPPPKPPKDVANSTIPGLDSIQSLQKHIISKGFSVGSTGADNKLGSNTIKGLQRMLIKEGYDVGQSQGYADDGILGSRTKSALEQYRNDNTPEQEEEEQEEELNNNKYKTIYNNVQTTYYKGSSGYLGKCDEQQCAEFVQMELSRNMGIPLRELQQKGGVVGSAWDLGRNIRAKGGNNLYSTYENVDRLDEINFSQGDVVTMYTGGRSQFQGDAQQAGVDTSHAGIVDSDVMKDDKGRYVYILHNVHKTAGYKNGKAFYQGHKYRDKLYLDNFVGPKDNKRRELKLQYKNFKVREAFSPNYGGTKGLTVNPDMKISSGEYNSPVAKTMVKTLNDKKIQKKLMFDLGLTEQEYYDLAQASLGIIAQETKFGKTNAVPLIPGGMEIKGKEYAALAYKEGRTLLNKGNKVLTKFLNKSIFIDKEIPEEKFYGESSLGYGRIKYNTNFNQVKDRLEHSYGITKGSLATTFDNGKNSIVATLFALGNRYNRLKGNKDISEEDRMYLSIQQYNRYNLKRKYGKEDKSAMEYSKDRDLSYSNKVLQYGSDFKVQDKNTTYNTMVNNLNRDPRIVEKQMRRSNLIQ